MKLYHGTFNDVLLKIINSKVLDNTKTAEVTEEFDNVIERYLGFNLTENALYMSDNTATGYDFYFELNVEKDLDVDYLFVADTHLREEILDYIEDDKILNAVKKYKNSLVPFTQYLKEKRRYECAEYLYFKEIDILAYLEKNKQDILEHLEEDWGFNEDYKEQIKDYIA